MVHCGYEASAALGVNKKLGDTLKMLSWTVSGKMGGLLGEPTEREKKLTAMAMAIRMATATAPATAAFRSA